MFNIEITKRLLNKEMTNKYIFFKIQLDRDTHYKTFGRGKGVCVCVCVCGGGGGGGTWVIFRCPFTVYFALRTSAPLQFILWPIMDPIFVTFG